MAQEDAALFISEAPRGPIIVTSCVTGALCDPLSSPLLVATTPSMPVLSTLPALLHLLQSHQSRNLQPLPSKRLFPDSSNIGHL